MKFIVQANGRFEAENIEDARRQLANTLNPDFDEEKGGAAKFDRGSMEVVPDGEADREYPFSSPDGGLTQDQLKDVAHAVEIVREGNFAIICPTGKVMLGNDLLKMCYAAQCEAEGVQLKASLESLRSFMSQLVVEPVDEPAQQLN